MGRLRKASLVSAHGTDSRYCNDRCRCAECVAAHRVAHNRNNGVRRRRLAQGLAPYVVHGTYSTYSNWGCRCDPCCDGRLAYVRARREHAS